MTQRKFDFTGGVALVTGHSLAVDGGWVAQ
jgi:hypothetical protein